MNDTVAARLRQGQIVLGAMIVGLLTLAIIALVLAPRLHAGTDPLLPKVLLLALGGLIVLEFPAYVVVRNAVLGRLRREFQDRPVMDELAERLIGPMFTLTLIPAAMLEGWGLFGGIVYLLTVAWPALIAPAVAILGILTLIPTHGKFERFATDVTGQRWV